VAVKAALPFSPVAELLGQVDVQEVRQDADQLRGVAQSGADGVGRVDVVQLCGAQRSEVIGAASTTDHHLRSV